MCFYSIGFGRKPGEGNRFKLSMIFTVNSSPTLDCSDKLGLFYNSVLYSESLRLMFYSC